MLASEEQATTPKEHALDPFTLALIGAGIASATGIGSSIIGSITGANAQNVQQRAADQALQVQRDALNQQQANYQQQRQDQMPWLQAGQMSLSDLMQQMGNGSFDTKMDPSQIANDPGYQFRMAEGQKALERSAAARGGLNSGGFMKGLARYSQGVASDEYQNAFNRKQADVSGRYNRLASLAGVGQTASQSLGSLSAQNNANIGNYANGMGNMLGTLGSIQSSGAIAQGNALSGGLGTIGNLGQLGFMSGMTNSYGAGGGMGIPTQSQQGMGNSGGSLLAGRGNGWSPY